MTTTGKKPARWLAFAAAACVAAIVAGGPVPRADVAPTHVAPPSSGLSQSVAPSEDALLRVQVVGTERDGITGRPQFEEYDRLAIGQTLTKFVKTGEPGAQFCNCRFPLEPPASFVVLWRLDLRVQDIQAGRPTIEVQWTRTRGGEAPERTGSRVVTLGAGDVHVLDYVENPLESSRCPSLILRFAAESVPRIVKPIAIEFWAVDESNPTAGGVQYRRVESAVGKLVPYELPALEIPVAGPGGRVVKVGINGTVHAAQLDEGSVLIDLATTRRMFSGGNATGGRGQVQFRTKVGDTAAVVLPDPSGPLALAPGGLDVIDLAQTFANHRLSLYVKVVTTQ